MRGSMALICVFGTGAGWIAVRGKNQFESSYATNGLLCRISKYVFGVDMVLRAM